VEWLGTVLLVALLLAATLAVGGAGLRAMGVARAILTRLLCAADLSGACSESSRLVLAYGPELAAMVSRRAPEIVYEDGMTALPVDFRSCRAGRCGNGPDSGVVWASNTGEPAVAFVHAVDCRTPQTAGAADRGYDCSGSRAGNVYLQYWLYYSDSTSLRALPGDVGHHEDDWEGYQARVGAAGADARATSHHGYAYRGGPVNWLSDAGVVSKPAWDRATGRLYVSGGSHAGHVYEPGRRGPLEGARRTPTSRLILVPIETLPAAARRTRFAIVPPWRKPVYRDPEDQGT
jgi:hypothetical protein